MAQTSEIDAYASSAYTFDPFAQHQFYTALNRALVERAIGMLAAEIPAGRPARVVELASGTGAVTTQILDALERRGRRAEVIGVEPSPAAIAVAERRLEGRGVTFIRGDAEELGAAAPADTAFFFNAIHLVPDKDAAVETIARVLRPGGFFALNSSFYTGAYAAGTERFYHLWTRRALGWLRQHHPEARVAHHGKTTAMQWLSPEDYGALLRRHGLEVAYQEVEEAQLPLRAWQDIGRYSLFIEGALPGVPVPIGAEALEDGAARAFGELGLDAVPRNWLQIVARRRA
jgi:ubiquinone/menaquinone biosynthesis C-methylase UbiE